MKECKISFLWSMVIGRWSKKDMPHSKFEHNNPFALECGKSLPSVTIAYSHYGELNAQKDNVIYVCHALTANSDVADWWPNMVGPGLAFDTDKYFVVCAN